MRCISAMLGMSSNCPSIIAGRMDGGLACRPGAFCMVSCHESLFCETTPQLLLFAAPPLHPATSKFPEPRALHRLMSALLATCSMGASRLTEAINTLRCGVFAATICVLTRFVRDSAVCDMFCPNIIVLPARQPACRLTLRVALVSLLR